MSAQEAVVLVAEGFAIGFFGSAIFGGIVLVLVILGARETLAKFMGIR